MFDSSNEASGCTGYNAKNRNSFKCNVTEKIRKNLQKKDFFGIFLDFFSNSTLQRVEVFLRCYQCIQTSHDRRGLSGISSRIFRICYDLLETVTVDQGEVRRGQKRPLKKTNIYNIRVLKCWGHATTNFFWT